MILLVRDNAKVEFGRTMADYTEKFVSDVHQEQHRTATDSADPSSMSSLILTSPKSSKSSKSPKSPKSSSKGQQSRQNGSPLKNQKHSHCGKEGLSKKGELLKTYFRCAEDFLFEGC